MTGYYCIAFYPRFICANHGVRLQTSNVSDKGCNSQMEGGNGWVKRS